jgi:formylmethanofuran dehydrogenase subunit E-like metal-binding protein
VIAAQNQTFRERDLESVIFCTRQHSIQTGSDVTPCLQSFFDVLTSVASTASELMVGRERTVTQLMMKLADILASTLTGDVDFWAEVDQQGLGPNALKQV